MDGICVACLARNRNLFPINEYWHIFKIIKRGHHSLISNKKSVLKICWECRAYLKKFQTFREKTLQSLNILQQYNNINKVNQCLSSLSIVRLIGVDPTNETNIEYIEEPNTKTEYVDIPSNKMKNEICFLANDIFVSPDPNDSMEMKEEEKEMCKSNESMNSFYADDSADCMLDSTEINNDQNDFTEELDKPNQEKLEQNVLELWSYELVDDQQLQEWRSKDENDSRYMRLHNKCQTCLMAFNYEEQLILHNAAYHSKSLGSHICDICRRRFPEESTMKEHRKEHYMQYKCLVCEFKCRDINNLKKHLTDHHTEATWKCDKCDAVFKTAPRLRYHKDKHRDKYKCRHCDKKFSLRNNMYSHMLIKHGNLPQAQCHICKKMYKNKYALKIHLRVHDETKETFYCALCKVHFKNAVIYKNHFAYSMKHLKPEELKHECKECGRRFVTERRRQSHYNCVHLKKGQFACDRCPKSYATRRSLGSHVAQKHEGNYVEPPRDKICDFCGKGFTSSTILKTHLRTHTGERPYQCKLCTSTFGHSASLYTHNKLVHEKVKRKNSKKKKEKAQSENHGNEKCRQIV